MNTPVQQGKVYKANYTVSQNTGISSKRPKHNYATKLAMELWATKLWDKRQLTTRYQRLKARAPLKQPSWQWDLGHKTIKQNNRKKGVTVVQSPATWDRTHTQTTMNNHKRETRVSILTFGKRSHTNYNLLVRQCQTKLAVQ